ncbi:MAG: hypothetical protein EOP61_34120 [Sphingomonadales bacterium]|nr:MAG: hypothetical protein EOP61_34120 [Sphingomonadales bacterium]
MKPAPSRRGALAALLLATGAAAEAAHIRPALEAETLRPAPGSRLRLALSMTPLPGWHGYWQNPGDSGAPASVAWTLPARSAIGPLRYPVPQRFLTRGLMNYVYEQPYALLTSLSVPKAAVPGTQLRITGKVRWLACSATLCVPEQAVVAIDLIVGDGERAPAARRRFDGWSARLPAPLGKMALFDRDKDRIRIAVPFARDRPLTGAYFYPLTPRLIDHAAPQIITRRGEKVIVELRAAENASPMERIEGVLVSGSARGISLIARAR